MAPFYEGKSLPEGENAVSVKKGEIPYFIQYDSRWGLLDYGSGPMGFTGCGPTCLAMAAAGLTGNADFTPDDVADYAEANGYYVTGAGTAWSLFTDGAAAFGLTGRQMALDESDMKDVINSGGVIIASMQSGDFTTEGHFIVIWGYGLGGFKVYDPNNIEKSSRTWSYTRLKPQIAAVWSITAAE